MQRAPIVALASLEPIAEGLHITHWSSRLGPAKRSTTRSCPAISAATVRPHFPADVDLQPHRTRYWKTARLDARFEERGGGQVPSVLSECGSTCPAGASGLCASIRCRPCQVLERHVRPGRPALGDFASKELPAAKSTSFALLLAELPPSTRMVRRLHTPSASAPRALLPGGEIDSSRSQSAYA